MRFDERVIVLTGVGREGQVGETVARAFAQRGAMVVLVDRQAEEVGARASALRGLGLRAWGYACDLTDPAQVEHVARRTAATHGGRIDALVNLAGGFATSGAIPESDPAVWHRQIAINLTTAYLATRAFLPLLRPASGAVIYFASAAALPGASTAGMSAYVVAKSGILALARVVADEERESGVRPNVIAPTAIRTRDNLASMGDGTAYVEKEAVAEIVVFLCSDEARAIRGQVVRLG